MLQVEDAIGLILEAARAVAPFDQERVSLEEALDRVVAQDVHCRTDMPAHDYSAMDGYAFRLADLSSSDSRALPLCGHARTGHAVPPWTAGTCMRIFTGAHIPLGADTVIAQEDVSREGNLCVFRPPFRQGSHIRRAGEDLRAGDLAVGAGVRINPYVLGLLASVDRADVIVARRPRVVVVCTGDELRAPGFPEAGGLAESNSHALVALAARGGATSRRAPLVPDELGAMQQAIGQALQGSDLVVTVGGVSVGDHDLVRPALEGLGAEILFHKVAMRPGKPALFARCGSSLVLGLPGNPSSAMVVFSLLGVPLLRALQGDGQPLPSSRPARLKRAFAQKPGRRGYYPARISGDEVEVLENRASGASTSIAWANCFAVIDAASMELEVGSQVQVLSYGDF
jgi:molybdopterin molybdotransferase